jgi:hypothetical protein
LVFGLWSLVFGAWSKGNGQRPTTGDQRLFLRVPNRIDLAIDAGRIAGCGVDGLSPLLVFAVEPGLLQKIGSLEDRIERIAQVVDKNAKAGDCVRRLGEIFRGGAPWFSRVRFCEAEFSRVWFSRV